jgi:hypothetical protein
MDNDTQGGFLHSKIFGIPAIVVIGGIGLIVYFIFFKNSSSTSSGSPSTSGGGGSVTTGATTIDKGAVQISVTQEPGGNTQPAPPATGATSAKTASVPLKKVNSTEDRLGSASDLYYIAKKLGISEAELIKLNPSLKKYEGTGKAVPSGTKIKVK